MSYKDVFVYGALMGKMKERHNPVAAKIEDYQITFTVKGLPNWEPSFAALVPARNKCAWGIIATLSEEEWKKYRKHEKSYKEATLTVVTKEGRERKCSVLARREPEKDNRLEENPSARYARTLQQAAKKYSFPEEIIYKYSELMRKGSKKTLYFKWLVPLTKAIVPYTSLKVAFYASLFLPLFLVLPLIYFFSKLFHS